MTLLDDVLNYAGRGWQVFPLKREAKEPATRRGFYDATGNPATLRRWFEKFPYNVGIRTGTASAIFVLDIDGALGFASLAEIEFEHGRLPPTLASSTGNGRHLWFVADAPIPCSTGKLGAGLDVKADLGYVAAPPSTHPNGKIYRWLDDSIPPAPAPEWLVQLACTKPQSISEHALANLHQRTSRSLDVVSEAYGLAALDREVEALAGTAPGARNCTLNRCAFRLFQLVAGGELDRDHVIERLIDACHRNGLVSDDGWRPVMATIHSAMRAGLQYPRSRSGAA